MLTGASSICELDVEGAETYLRAVKNRRTTEWNRIL
jgi:hypothetical protein